MYSCKFGDLIICSPENSEKVANNKGKNSSVYFGLNWQILCWRKNKGNLYIWEQSVTIDACNR